MTLTIAQEAAGVVPDTIRAIVVDPVGPSIRTIDLPTVSGDTERGFGAQIDAEALVALLGSKVVGQLDLGEEVLLHALTGGKAWRFGIDDMIEGVGVLVGYDAAPLDHYRSIRRDPEDLVGLIEFDVLGEADDEEAHHGCEAA